MTVDDLAADLRDACLKAPKGAKAVTIHLFGIRNAAHLDGHDLKDLASRAGLDESWATEIRKGVRLAEHVTLK